MCISYIYTNVSGSYKAVGCAYIVMVNTLQAHNETKIRETSHVNTRNHLLQTRKKKKKN